MIYSRIETNNKIRFEKIIIEIAVDWKRFYQDQIIGSRKDVGKLIVCRLVS